jgi:anaerobic selenocysteine-containing dehydrogenase
VFTELAKRLGLGEQFPWKSEEELVRHELGPTGLSFEYLLNEKPEGDFYQQKVYGVSERAFPTPSGKIEIYSEAVAQVGHDPLPVYIEPVRSPRNQDKAFLERYPLILSTGNRSYYYTHSQFRGVGPLREKRPEPSAELSPATAARFGIAQGAPVVVETNRGRVKMKARLDERVADGVVLVPHGWPGEQNANLLTDTKCREEILGYPDMKSLMCSIRPE